MGIFDAVLGYLGQEDTNDTNMQIANNTTAFNAQEAALNRDFQERMSNTSWQRGVADMQAAGINPMLAFEKGGASSPAGSVAQGVSTTVGNSLGAAVNTGYTASKMVEDIKNVAAQTEKTKAEARVADSQAAVNAAMVPELEQRVRTGVSSSAQLDAMTREILEKLPFAKEQLKADTDLKLVQKGTAESQGGLNFAKAQEAWSNVNAIDRRNLAGGPEAEVALLKERGGLAAADALLSKIHHEAVGLSLPKARNEAEAQKSWWNRTISPYLSDVLKSSSSAYGFSRAMR